MPKKSKPQSKPRYQICIAINAEQSAVLKELRSVHGIDTTWLVLSGVTAKLIAMSADNQGLREYRSRWLKA